MRKLFVVTSFILLLTVFVVMPAHAATSAPEAKPYYGGKMITFIIGAASGGGTNVFAGLMVHFLPRYIAGNPNFILEFMPAGSGVAAGNYVYTKSKPDGLNIFVGNGTTLVEAQKRREKGVLYDVSKMHVLLGNVTGYVCFVSPATGIRQPRDIINPKAEIFRGSQVRSGSTSLEADIPMLEIFKVKRYKPIYGYGDTGPARMAFIRGETNMMCDNTLAYTSSVVQQMIQEGKAVPVFQSGILEPEGKLIRHPGVPDVPTVAELYQQIYGVPPSGIAWQVLQYLQRTRSFAKIMAFPPETPLQRVEELQKALRNLVKDPEWIAETKRVTGEAIVPPLVTIGEEVQQLIRESIDTGGEVSEWLEKWAAGK